MNNKFIPPLPIFALLVAVAAGRPEPKAERPNIIIVMADDMGFSDLGCYGGEIKTPAIDRLAREGIRFSQFYNCALCGPSRASLMTGCYPWDIGQAPGKSIFANLKTNCATIMELLKADGYLTCAVGRLDMTTGGNWHDPAQLSGTLDRFLGVPTNGPGNYYKAVKGQPWFKNGKPFQRPTGKHSTNLISDFVAEFIEASATNSSPFAIYVSHFAPHWPLHADEEDVAPYRTIYQSGTLAELMQARLHRQIDAGIIPEGTTLHPSMLKASEKGSIPVKARMALHAAMVEGIDHGVADMIKALKKTGQHDNTLILVFSDNGASHQMAYNRPVPEGARPGGVNTFINQGPAVASLNNTPFRSYKQSNYEGGIASPLVAWWRQGMKKPGRVSHVPCHIADIMPTCLELSGAPYPAVFRGRTLTPLAGQSLTPMLYQPDHKKVRTLVWPKAIREGDWKLIPGKKPELFNIREDRNEQHNRAAEFPDRVARLKRLHGERFSP